MPKISSVLFFTIVGDFPLSEKTPRQRDDQIDVWMHKLAIGRIDDIKEAAFLMKAKCQRTILFAITEGELHLITIAIYHRRWDDRLGEMTIRCIADVGIGLLL